MIAAVLKLYINCKYYRYQYDPSNYMMSFEQRKLCNMKQPSLAQHDEHESRHFKRVLNYVSDVIGYRTI